MTSSSFPWTRVFAGRSHGIRRCCCCYSENVWKVLQSGKIESLFVYLFTILCKKSCFHRDLFHWTIKPSFYRAAVLARITASYGTLQYWSWELTANNLINSSVITSYCQVNTDWNRVVASVVWWRVGVGCGRWHVILTIFCSVHKLPKIEQRGCGTGLKTIPPVYHRSVAASSGANLIRITRKMKEFRREEKFLRFEFITSSDQHKDEEEKSLALTV